MATPYEQPRPRARRGRGGVVGPLLLIFIGGVFLLQNAGILPPSVWGNLWRLWPLVLVLVGLELLIGRRLPGLFAIFGLGIVVVALIVAAYAYAVPGAARGALSTQTFTTELGSAKQSAVTIRFVGSRAHDELYRHRRYWPPRISDQRSRWGELLPAQWRRLRQPAHGDRTCA